MRENRYGPVTSVAAGVYNSRGFFFDGNAERCATPRKGKGRAKKDERPNSPDESWNLRDRRLRYDHDKSRSHRAVARARFRRDPEFFVTIARPQQLWCWFLTTAYNKLFYCFSFSTITSLSWCFFFLQKLFLSKKLRFIRPFWKNKYSRFGDYKSDRDLSVGFLSFSKSLWEV